MQLGVTTKWQNTCMCSNIYMSGTYNSAKVVAVSEEPFTSLKTRCLVALWVFTVRIKNHLGRMEKRDGCESFCRLTDETMLQELLR